MHLPHRTAGEVTIAFASLVGASTLLAWDREFGSIAVEKFQLEAVQGLSCPVAGTGGSQAPGYVVELAGELWEMEAGPHLLTSHILVALTVALTAGLC